MESSENENAMIIDGENEIGLNEWNMEDEIINGNLQIEQNTLEEYQIPMKTMKWKETFKHCILKGKNGKNIKGMQFVRLFIM
jgi:hypothetical protein